MWFDEWKCLWKKRRNFAVLAVFLIAGNVCQAQELKTADIPKELSDLYARSAVLMDGDSGRVLFGKNEEECLPMASTTKILTCILALELGQPEEICRVSSKAASQPKVHLGMKEGEMYYLKDLLYSLMLESHNDTAVCVAEHIGGSVEAFAERMNQKAREIGCEQAYFITSNGLDGSDVEGDHSITAKELGLIMRYCIMTSEKKEEFLQITRAGSYTFQDVSGKRNFSCSNHNTLLTMMEGALTGKTGFTNKAGYCYVGAVRRGEQTLIVALLACGWPNNRNYKWADTKKLIEYGFSNYEKKSLNLENLIFPALKVRKGEAEQTEITVGTGQRNGKEFGKELQIAVLAEPEQELHARIRCEMILEAPVDAGQRIGQLQILLDEEILREYSLVSKCSVKKITYGFCLNKVLKECLF